MSRIRFLPVASRRQFILRASALAGGSAVGLYGRYGLAGPSTQALVLPLAAGGSADAVIWDGVSGVAGGHFNYAAGLPWTNKGGDWLDAARIPQGGQAYAS